MDSRKRRRIEDDDEDDDDSKASNDVDRSIIDVDENDDDSKDEDDDGDGDYDEDEDDNDEASDDVDDDEVDDKSSNPPGINDSLAFSNKGGEKRSGSIVVNVEQGCNRPPPPSAHQGRSRSRSRSRSGSNEATVEWGSKAPPPSQEGKKRSGSNVASVVRGCERPPRRGTNPQQNQRNKRGKKNKEKNRRDTSSSPPHGSLISRNSSSNTVGTYESPPFVPRNVGPETFSKDDTDNEYMCSYCRLEYLAFSNDLQNPSLPFLLCRHRFCRECINKMEGGQDCPVTGCVGKNHGKSFRSDDELIRRIIVKSCFEKDRQSANNGVITDDVAGSSRRNQSSSLTSG